MPSFKDSNGREWMLRLDAPTIRAIRQSLDVNLASFDGPTFARLGSDPCLLVDVLWLMCREQAQPIGVTDEQFGRSLVADSLEAGSDALLEAIVDFSPSRRAKVLKEMIRKAGQIQEQQIKRAEAEVARWNTTPSSSVTNWPDSSGSLPAD